MTWKFETGEIIKRRVDGVEFVVLEAFTGVMLRRANGDFVWCDPPRYKIAQCGVSWTPINMLKDEEFLFDSTGEMVTVSLL